MDMNGLDEKIKNTGYGLKTKWRSCHVFTDPQYIF